MNNTKENCYNCCPTKHTSQLQLCISGKIILTFWKHEWSRLVHIWCSSFPWTTPCFLVRTNTLAGSKINTPACPSANTQYHWRPVGFHNICWHYGLLKQFSWDAFIGHLLHTFNTEHEVLTQTNKLVSPCCLCTLFIWHWVDTWVYLNNHVWRFWRKHSRGNLRPNKL